MKKFISALILCTGIILSGCKANNASSAEDRVYTEGLFLRSTNDDAIIIIDGTGPCTMQTDEDDMFAEFTDGDVIKIEYDGTIAETYPGQIDHVYSAELIKDGERSDIDSNILEELISMGWIE